MPGPTPWPEPSSQASPNPCRRPREARAAVGEQWWADLHTPLGELVERTFRHDLVRGVVLTDALIGTFADAHDATLAQNRCFLYHVIGGGTGDWDVPVGGMGAVVDALTDAARSAGAELRDPRDGARASTRTAGTAPRSTWTDDDGREHAVTAAHVLVNAAPRVLDGLLGHEPAGAGPEGSQLKVNMVLRRLPRLRDASVDPSTAFAGTFHINESYDQLATAHAQAAAGRIPTLPPAEIYCHTLTDGSILGDELRASGHHTLTLFGLHMPARLFRADPEGAREAALAATLRSLNSALAEPIEDCLAPDARRPPLPGGPHARGPGAGDRAARGPHLPPRPAVAVARGRGSGGRRVPSRALGRRDRPPARPAVRCGRPTRRRRERHPRQVCRHGRAGVHAPPLTRRAHEIANHPASLAVKALPAADHPPPPTRSSGSPAPFRLALPACTGRVGCEERHVLR